MLKSIFQSRRESAALNNAVLARLQRPNTSLLPRMLSQIEARLTRNQLRLFYEDVGQPLEEHLRGGRLPLAQARDVLRQILIALAHCHCQGITHRNLKPKYVLLRRNDGDDGSHAAAASSWTAANGRGGRGDADGEGEWQVKLSDFNSVRWLGVQRHGGEFGRAGKGHAQGGSTHGGGAQASSLARLTILVLMRFRLSGARYSTKTLPSRWSSSCCSSSLVAAGSCAQSSVSPVSFSNSTEMELLRRTLHRTQGSDMQSSHSVMVSVERHTMRGSESTRV